MDQKSFLQSKTIFGILLMIFTQLAPLFGFNFSTEDHAAVTGIIDQLYASADHIMFGIGALIAMYGRVTSTTTIGMTNERAESPWLVSALALLLVGGCVGGTGTAGANENLSMQTRYYQAKATYALAKEEAAAYAAQPFCDGNAVVVACADPAIVIRMADASNAADDAFKKAEPYIILLDPKAVVTAAGQANALKTATVALGQLTAILALAIASGEVT